LPFRPDFQNALLHGIKTCTSRTVKMIGEPYDTFEAFGATFEIVQVYKMRLWEVADKLWDKEGCRSQEHFVEIWKSIHPVAGFQPTQKVRVYFFEKVKTGG